MANCYKVNVVSNISSSSSAIVADAVSMSVRQAQLKKKKNPARDRSSRTKAETKRERKKERKKELYLIPSLAVFPLNGRHRANSTANVC